MADEESKPSSSIIKYLLIGIAFLATMVLSAGVSIFTYKSIIEKKEASVEPDFTVKESIEFEEFSIQPTSEKGQIKFRLFVEVNDSKVKDYLSMKKAVIRDNISRAIMPFGIQEIRVAYQTSKLHSAIKKELNAIIGDNIKSESSLFGMAKKKKYMVLNVSIYDFSAVVFD